MNLKEKISLEKIFEKEYKIKVVEPENNKEAVITHFLHNNKNGVSQFYKKDAVNFTKEILQYKYPEEEITNIKDFGVPRNREKIYIVGFRNDLGVPFGRAFRSNLFVCSSQKGFPLQSLTQMVA